MATPASRAAPAPRPPLFSDVSALAASLAVAMIAVAAAARLANLGVYSGSFDEGVRVQQLSLMAAGYRPFRDIFASQGVLLLDALYPFFALGGQTLFGARLGVAVFSMLGLIASWWAARELAGAWGGAFAIALLAISPLYLQGSRQALAEVPSLASCLLAVAACLAYVRGGGRWLAVFACLAAASALLVKPMAIPILPALGIAFLLRGRRAWPELLVGATLAGLLIVVAVLVMGPAGVYEQLVAYRGGASTALDTDSGANVRLLLQAWRAEGWGLPVLAAVSGVLLLVRSPRLALVPVVWALATLAMLVSYDDLSDKHLVYLIPPLALLAATGASIGWTRGRLDVAADRSPPPARGTPRDRVVMIAGIIGVGAYLSTLPLALSQSVMIVWPDVAAIERRRDRDTERQLVRHFQELSTTDGFVISDNPLAAFEAHRLVPPWLADPSGTRVDAGSLSARLLIEQVQRYRPRVVATWSGRTGKLGEYVDWLDQHYRLEATYADGAWRVYAAPSTS